MAEIINSPLFGVLISLVCFEISIALYNKFKAPLLNPLLISTILIISTLLMFNISFEQYNSGCKFISFFLGPATVVLAVPLYNKLELLKKNLIPLLSGILVGSIAGIVSIIFLSYVLNLDLSIIKSLIPKSTTVPIGIEISKGLGGIPSLTVFAIIVSGIIGSIIGPLLFKIFKIEDSLSKGIAFGTASHALGTAKAFEIGETEGAISSICIAVAGIITVFIAPLIYNICTSILGI
ncbi:LrgB family protein [Clostridium algidicarnis]|uniref:Putative murein hydrolase (TIGR00659 family) n=1 Tax=Clostridium algidicarnis DSM 15099 TaxID=1121295 RepID=A0A2S6FZG9_9CLOT|nr:LrgB family protein [Clostridium algidicarnis]MBU3194138.1 LrgB family protein [Clostridium algidicarnis]PPK49027.1 putative murein hydrolase (TIGR00659 family) [Clostridium algidicarnis DSM 15099]